MFAYFGDFAFLCIMDIVEVIMFIVIAIAFHIAAAFGMSKKNERIFRRD